MFPMNIPQNTMQIDWSAHLSYEPNLTEPTESDQDVWRCAFSLLDLKKDGLAFFNEWSIQWEMFILQK